MVVPPETDIVKATLECGLAAKHVRITHIDTPLLVETPPNFRRVAKFRRGGAPEFQRIG